MKSLQDEKAYSFRKAKGSDEFDNERMEGDIAKDDSTHFKNRIILIEHSMFVAQWIGGREWILYLLCAAYEYTLISFAPQRAGGRMGEAPSKCRAGV